MTLPSHSSGIDPAKLPAKAVEAAAILWWDSYLALGVMQDDGSVRAERWDETTEDMKDGMRTQVREVGARLLSALMEDDEAMERGLHALALGSQSVVHPRASDVRAALLAAVQEER